MPATPGGDAAAARPLPPPPPPPASVPPHYSLANIAAAAAGGAALSPAALAVAAESVPTSACFRPAFLWAAALGGLFAAHRFKQGGSLHRATGDGALAGLATFGSQWYFCRADEVDRKAVMEAYFARQSRKTSGANAPRAADEPPPAAGGGGGGADARAVAAELDRVVAYDLPTVTRGPAQSVAIR
jgi:hypothetical protein